MASAQEHGFCQIQKFNQSRKIRLPLKEQRSERLGYVAPASHTNPQEQDEPLAFLEGGVAVDEKELIEFWFTSDAADTIESEESKLLMDVTIRDKKTGAELPSMITFDTMTGFTAAGTVDIACIANAPTRVAYQEALTGQQIALGRRDGRGKIYAYLGDDTA